MNIKKTILIGVAGYTGVKVLTGYTGLVYNIGKLSGYLDVINDVSKKGKNAKEKAID